MYKLYKTDYDTGQKKKVMNFLARPSHEMLQKLIFGDSSEKVNYDIKMSSDDPSAIFLELDDCVYELRKS